MTNEIKISNAISATNAYALLEYFDEKIQIRDHYHGGKKIHGSKEAITFFEDFFAEYKSRSNPVLIFCRFIDEFGCTPVIAEEFKTYCASHDFFIHLQQGKIIRIEIFPSLDHSMRFFVDDIDAM